MAEPCSPKGTFVNTKRFSDEDLNDEDWEVVHRMVHEGKVAASMLVLASVGEALAELEPDTMADLALMMGQSADWLETAIANINVWYRDEYPDGIDHTVMDAKIGTMTTA